ncbi:type II secretion system protein [Candidatus Microgenomates bacterium]|nr:type II secretion system protein [Candidatus Microgenomates bacterium]
MRSLRAEHGFTLVELIVAMAFFGFMLALLSVGVLQIMRMYQSNLSSRRTQQAARLAVEEITREVRSASTAETSNFLCLEGQTRVVLAMGGNNSLVKKSNASDCSDISGAQNIIDGSDSIQLREFTYTAIQAVGTVGASIQFTLVVTTGDDALLSGSDCSAGPGSQYCSSTTYTNVVSLRGSQ